MRLEQVANANHCTMLKNIDVNRNILLEITYSIYEIHYKDKKTIERSVNLTAI